jgi:pantoate--beta-alanine ligase
MQQLAQYRVDAVFAPDIEEMYPRGTAAMTEINVRGLSDILEGEYRPGFFRGVATVVNKLFNIVQPDAAYFGRKDYQQLLVVSRMVQDLDQPVEIHAVPTVREADGLALSSRNTYLNAAERRLASKLFACLQQLVNEIRLGTDAAYAVGHASRELELAGLVPDYVVVRCRNTLDIPSADDRNLIVLAAVWLGETRLIDNIAFDLEAP